MSQGTELAPLIGRYPSVPALTDIEFDAEPWYTYMSPTDVDRRPNRTIDYVFHASSLSRSAGEVLRDDATGLSDHLPIAVEFTLPNSTP